MMEKHNPFLINRILEDMSDGVIVFNFSGEVILHNPAAERILRFPEGALANRTIAELMQQFDENDALFELVLDAVYTKKKVIKTVPYVSGDEMLYLRITTDLLTNGGEKIGVIAHISDITDGALLSIENRRLAAEISDLMNSFVEVMVTAIEEKSPYNANHTRSMVKYAGRYLDWLAAKGALTDHTNAETAPLLMSIWLHDIGKLLVPTEVMDKPTRLGNTEKDILNRIETALLMLRIKTLTEPEEREKREAEAEKLRAARELILSANTAGFLDDETIRRLREAAELECLTADGGTVPLLSDAEKDAITVVRGTLTAKERSIIESHVSLTEKLLSKMRFRGNYQAVPQWASRHHELLDGSGYPHHLKADSIPWEVRLLTIIDIYDALTAEDRPYKPSMPPERALSILQEMAEQGKLDPDLLASFIESEAWK